MPIFYQVFVIIFVTCIIQSIFGVGLLLFGTPLLLLVGLDFPRVLSILLPCSMMVSFLQVLKDKEEIDWTTIKKMLIFALPSIIITSLIVLSFKNSINMNLLIGLVLILISFMSFFEINLFSYLKKIRMDFCYFIFLGIVHGASNLGGSLLSVYVKDTCQTRKKIRATIAINYFLFAACQLAVLVLNQKFVAYEYDISNVCLVFLTTAIIGRILFTRINDFVYVKVFNAFILIMGLTFIMKS